MFWCTFVIPGWKFLYDFSSLISSPLTLQHEFLDLVFCPTPKSCDIIYISSLGVFFRCLLVFQYSILFNPIFYVWHSSFSWVSLLVMLSPLLFCLSHWIFIFSISTCQYQFPYLIFFQLATLCPLLMISFTFFSHVFFDVADFQLNALNWIIFFLNLFIYCICGWACAHQSTYMGVRGQLWGVSSFLPSYMS